MINMTNRTEFLASMDAAQQSKNQLTEYERIEHLNLNDLHQPLKVNKVKTDKGNNPSLICRIKSLILTFLKPQHL